MANLGVVFHDQGKLTEAEQLLRHVLEVETKYMGQTIRAR